MAILGYSILYVNEKTIFIKLKLPLLSLVRKGACKVLLLWKCLHYVGTVKHIRRN